MFEALFILTTVDAGTRVGRFMLQDTLGNLWKPMARPSWRPGVYATSAVVVGGWGYFLWVGATDPLGGINQLFPLFGIANQLLAAVALTVATTILIKSGRLRWAWVTAVPLAWDAAVTLTASWQKIFSSDPLIGFFAQRAKFQEALDAGKVIPPAKSLEDVGQIVTNSTVDGVLSILFAVLIVVVIADAARIWLQVLSGRRQPTLAEAPAEPSRLWAPSGLIPTAEDRARKDELEREPVGAGRDRDGGGG
jgi:carbon starvation protein